MPEALVETPAAIPVVVPDAVVGVVRRAGGRKPDSVIRQSGF